MAGQDDQGEKPDAPRVRVEHSGSINKGLNSVTALFLGAILTAIGLFVAYILVNDGKLPFTSEDEEKVTSEEIVSVYVMDQMQESVENAVVALYIKDINDDLFEILGETNESGEMLFDMSEINPMESTDFEILVDYNNDTKADLEGTLTYVMGQFVANKVRMYPWLTTDELGIVIQIPATLTESTESTRSTTQTPTTSSTVEKTDNNTTRTRIRSEVETETTVSKDNQSGKNKREGHTRSRQDSAQDFPIDITSNTKKVNIYCGGTDTYITDRTFKAKVTLHKNGNVVAKIIESSSVRNFDLDGFGVTSRVNMRNISLSRAHSKAQEILDKVVTEYKKAVIAKVVRDEKYVCFHGTARVNLEVEHTCSDGSTILMNPVDVKINKDTIDDFGYPIDAITVMAHNKDTDEAKETAKDLAEAVAEKIAKDKYDKSIQRADKKCYSGTSSARNDDDMLEDDLLEEDDMMMEDDLLEEDDTTSSATSSKNNIKLTVVLKNENGETTEKQIEPFSAKVTIETNGNVTGYIDGEMVSNEQYGLPSNTSTVSKTKANGILTQLISTEKILRAEVLQSLTGSVSYQLK